MSNPTLHSRIRVLVAKAFRAERLYGSMRNKQALSGVSEETLGELANDIRAQEWQKSHFLLRRTLNDILASTTSSSEVAQALALLRDRFKKKGSESAAEVKQLSAHLVEAAGREEFATTLKSSLSLISHKARAQANSVVAEELSALLESSGKGDVTIKLTEADKISFAKTGTLDEDILELPRQITDSKKTSGKSPTKSASNVIPLKRRFRR